MAQNSCNGKNGCSSDPGPSLITEPGIPKVPKSEIAMDQEYWLLYGYAGNGKGDVGQRIVQGRGVLLAKLQSLFGTPRLNVKVKSLIEGGEFPVESEVDFNFSNGTMWATARRMMGQYDAGF